MITTECPHTTHWQEAAGVVIQWSRALLESVIELEFVASRRCKAREHWKGCVRACIWLLVKKYTNTHTHTHTHKSHYGHRRRERETSA